MSKGTAALGVVLALSAVASHATADAAEARPKPKQSKQAKKSKRPHRIVKRFKTDNGYKCHRHFTRTRPDKGADWSSRKVRGRSFTHCFKIKPRRARGGSSAWVLPRHVVLCESGGNPRVVNRTAAGAANGYPAGLYQITGPTWRGYGGGQFAPSADQATVREQGIIALRVLRGQGPGAWACW